MSSSYGHTVRLLTAEELAALQVQYDKDIAWRKANYPNEPVPVYYLEGRYSTQCSFKCKEKAKYRLAYRYITGRAGRTTTAEKNICEKHAEKYLKPQEAI
jgi:hypothetical protein